MAFPACDYMVTLECGHRIKMRNFPFKQGKYVCNTPHCGIYRPQMWTQWTNLKFPDENRIYYNRELQ